MSSLTENAPGAEDAPSKMSLNGQSPDSTSTEGGEEKATTPVTADASADPEASRTKLQTVVIMLSLSASVFLAALDTSIITTALPTISEHFHSSAGYTWIGSAYLLATAASAPSWGKFSDIWGRKPIMLIASGVFFVGSLLAAGMSSPNSPRGHQANMMVTSERLYRHAYHRARHTRNWGGWAHCSGQYQYQ
jgi:hypothetical protein